LPPIGRPGGAYPSLNNPGSLPPIGGPRGMPPQGRMPPQRAPEENFNVQDNDNESQFRGSTRSKTKKFKKKVKKMKKMAV
jgi:hypothetical protein